MNAKTRWLGLGILLLTGLGLQAQITEDDFNLPSLARLEAQRVAYITDRLGLTAQESGQFWALVNEYELEQERINDKYKPGKPVSQMTDDEADAYIRATFQKDQDLLNLKKEYYARFQEVLSPAKIALFPMAEKEFKREVVRRARDRWIRSRLNPGRGRN